MSEAVLDHIYAATQIGGVIVARRLRARLVPFPGPQAVEPAGPTYEPPGAA